ncbi:MAG: glutamine--fructose-6-phosphate transaminase (isomerizing) [Gemmatimonadota bacterium]
MCGIVGYVGWQEAAPILLQALERLEYRGYDSAGVAIQNGAGLVTERTAGRVADLDALVRADGAKLAGSSGIAHTRWATHGPPTTANAHPHADCTGEIAVVHNGIIENAAVLRAELERKGHTFRSDTDTEVLAHLIEELWIPPLHLAVARALAMVEGTFGLAVVSSRELERLVCARRGSPLMVGIGEGETFAASDAAAILGHTRRVIYLDDGELAVLDADGCDVLEEDEFHRIVRVEKPIAELQWSLEEAQLGGHPHYMLKEIYEQPETLEATLRGRLLVETAEAHLGGLVELAPALEDARQIVMVACGTSWHASLLGKYMIEQYARVPVEVEYASEWRYRNPLLHPGTVVVGVSQSGETADTLAALRLAKERGCPTLGVVNVVGSSIARLVDGGIYLHAGPEIGVASTKAFTSQVVALALLALHLGRQRGLDEQEAGELAKALARLPNQVREVLARDGEVAELAARLVRHRNFLYLGRGYSYPVAMEGALKLKEISYVHAEGLSAAEMKHGPIALIDEEMPVVAVAPRDGVYDKVLSNLEEVKARGGRLIAVTTVPNGLARMADECLLVPATIEPLLPVLTIVPLQLLAYHIGVLRGCDVDKPRNLAKSVTVE